MSVKLAKNAGFCFGVSRAVETVQQEAAAGKQVVTLGPIIHNRHVVGKFESLGVGVIDTPEEAPAGATVIIRSHGVSKEVYDRLQQREVEIVDATCPFVERVHKAAREFAEKGLRVVVIGHPGHIEVKGIVGEVGEAVVISNVAAAREFCAATADAAARLGVVSQTTMNADEVAEIVAALKTRFKVETTAEVCNATKLRQDAVKAFGGDAVLVLGSASSSNTARLCECAPCRAFRAGTMDEVKSLDLSGVTHLGVTSGASTPEEFLKAAVAWLRGERT